MGSDLRFHGGDCGSSGRSGLEYWGGMVPKGHVNERFVTVLSGYAKRTSGVHWRGRHLRPAETRSNAIGSLGFAAVVTTVARESVSIRTVTKMYLLNRLWRQRWRGGGVVVIRLERQPHPPGRNIGRGAQPAPDIR